jgi:hypothetical protein
LEKDRGKGGELQKQPEENITKKTRHAAAQTTRAQEHALAEETRAKQPNQQSIGGGAHKCASGA